MEQAAPQGGQALGATPSDQLTLSPQQQADDILKRQSEFNVKLDALCKEYQFVITVARQDLQNGFVFVPQLMDQKFAPKPEEAPAAPVPETPGPVANPEAAEPAPAAEAPAEAPAEEAKTE